MYVKKQVANILKLKREMKDEKDSENSRREYKRSYENIDIKHYVDT